MHTLSKPIYKDLGSCTLFIFDLDGTLYDQAALKRRILLSLISRLLSFRTRIRDIRIISSFRRQREKHKGYASPTLESDQYRWCAQEMNITEHQVEKCIKEIMYALPLRYLLKARYPAIDELFESIKEQGRSIAIFSDYPVKEKMDALGLDADAYFCSMDPEFQQLKPSGRALETICMKMHIPKSKALLIGDRMDTDGESARIAGIPFLLVDTRKARTGQFYTNLLQMIQPGHGR